MEKGGEKDVRRLFTRKFLQNSKQLLSALPLECSNWSLLTAAGQWT